MIYSTDPDTPPLNLSNYKLSRSVATITDIWREYQYGILDHPAIRTLDELHGSAWRKTITEAKLYSRRRPIYKAIKILIAESFDEDGAIQFLTHQQNKMGLTKFCQSLTINLARRSSDILLIDTF